MGFGAASRFNLYLPLAVSQIVNCKLQLGNWALRPRTTNTIKNGKVHLKVVVVIVVGVVFVSKNNLHMGR